MNANSLAKTLIIKTWLESAANKLTTAGIPSARLDSEIILAHALNKKRTYLHAHPEAVLNNKIQKNADSMLESRLKRIPIAYIIGKKEFYGRDFIVNQNVLIPRPESENIINLLKYILSIPHFPIPNPQLVDVGAGSGCLGITAKLEFPNLDVTLTDIGSSALQVAKKNAELLNADVNFIKSNLLDAFLPPIYPFTRKNFVKRNFGGPSVILANLPYVDKAWIRSPETDFEPPQALFASDNGLALIKKLIVQASKLLPENGYLLLEADPVQHNTIIEYANNFGLIKTRVLGYALELTKRIDTDAVKAYQQNTYNCNNKN